MPLAWRRVEGNLRLVAEWSRAGTGRYHVELRNAAKIVASETVSVLPEKLTEAGFRQLISDLDHQLPARLAVALQAAGALAGMELVPPEKATVAQELARLRVAIWGSHREPGLITILDRLSREPYFRFRAHEAWVPLRMARRPHASGIARALTRPANISGPRLVEVLDKRVHPSYDTYENQVVALFHSQVRNRLRRLAIPHLLDASSLRELGDLRSGLESARRAASFLDGVRELNRAPTASSMVLLNRLEYRAAFQGYLKLNKHVAVRIDEPALETPLENLPDLYEAWGVLTVIATLATVAREYGYKVASETLVRPTVGGAFVALKRDGNCVLEMVHRETGRYVRAYPQRSFGRQTAPDDELPVKSISLRQIPDLTLAFGRDDQNFDLVIFDPKYRLIGEIVELPEDLRSGGPIKADIDRMHAYRDSLRDAAGRRVVKFAAILYPGPSLTYPPSVPKAEAQLGAFTANPRASASLIDSVTEVIRPYFE